MDRGWRGQNSGKEFNIQRLNEARNILTFAGDLIKCNLPRKQMKRLARYLEKIQLNSIDVIEGDAILIGMRKDASKTVSRLLQRLEVQLQQCAGTGVGSQSQTQLQPKTSYYCVGVCVGYTETVVTLLVNGRAAYTTAAAIGLFVPTAASNPDKRRQQAGSDATPSLPQNPLIHIMQSVFEQLLGFLESGFIPELPVQVPNAVGAGEPAAAAVSAAAAGRYPLNTELVVLSSCSPSPIVSRLLLVRAWNEMVKAIVPSIAHLLPKPSLSEAEADTETETGGRECVNSPGRQQHGDGGDEGWGQPAASGRAGHQQAVLPALTGVKVVHSHAAAAALLAAYYSGDSYALFKATPAPLLCLPLDGRGTDGQVEANAEVEIDFSADCDAVDGVTAVGSSCAPTDGATSSTAAADHSGAEGSHSLEIRCCEGVLHVVVSIEDLILYVSVLLVTTVWTRPAAGPGQYRARCSSVRWLHHSRHCFKPLLVAKIDPRSGRSNQFASKDEVSEFLASVWELHVLRAPVPDHSQDSTAGTDTPLTDVHAFLQVYPMRGVHFVGKECGLYARRHDKQEALLCAPRREGVAAEVGRSADLHLHLPYERAVAVTDETKGINNYHNNVRSGVFDRPKSDFYSDAQKQRHSFLRQLEEFFCRCPLHSDEERRTTRAVALAVTDAAGGDSDCPAAVALMATLKELLVPTPNYLLPVLLSFELSGVQNEALGAALFGAGCLLAHSDVGAGLGRGGDSDRLNVPPRTLRQQLEAMQMPSEPADVGVLPPTPPAAAASAVPEPLSCPAPVSDVSGYSIGIRSTGRQSSPHDSGCGAGADSLFNLGCGLPGGSHSPPVVPLLFMPFITTSMPLPATVTHELELFDASSTSASASASASACPTGYPRSYQLDVMVSSNINKYFCRPSQFARVRIDDSDSDRSLGGNDCAIVLVVTLSLNERREVLMSVSRRSSAGQPAVVLLKRQRLAYTPQVAVLSDHWRHWTCSAMGSRYKDLGNSAMKAAGAKRVEAEAVGEALSAKEEEARRQVWVQRRHRLLQLALLFYSEGLRFDPCNHLLLSNRCAVLSHLESSGGNALSNRSLAGANLDHRGRPVASWFANKATVYLATTYLFSALFDAKECIRHSNFEFSKGFIRLGAIYYQLKKYHNALALYRFGLHLDPTNQSITASIIDTQEKILALEGSSPGSEPVNYVKSLADRFKELHSQKDKANKTKNKEQQNARKQFKINIM